MSHLPSVLASRSNTQPFLLRVNRTCDPSGEKRGYQSTASPEVMLWTPVPSVFITKRSWLPSRELDQTMIPLALPPTSAISFCSSADGLSSLPLGAAPPMVAQPVATSVTAPQSAR